MRTRDPFVLPNTFKVQVTQDDIERGRKQDCNKCPIARAGRRFLKAQNPGRALNVEVMHGEMDVVEPGRGRLAVYDHDGRMFIDDFDHATRGAKPGPVLVTFTLRIRDGRYH